MSVAVSSVSNPVISDSEGGGHSCESLSESQLHEVFTYALGRLFKGVPPPSCVQSPVAEGSADGSGEPPEITLSPPPVCSLLVFYRVGRAPSSQLVLEVIKKLDEFNVATTIVPVCQLNHPNTFISLCASRHEWTVVIFMAGTGLHQVCSQRKSHRTGKPRRKRLLASNYFV